MFGLKNAAQRKMAITYKKVRELADKYSSNPDQDIDDIVQRYIQHNTLKPIPIIDRRRDASKQIRHASAQRHQKLEALDHDL